MAIFSGGRWIRGQLVGAGEDFWARSPTTRRPESEQVVQEKRGLLEDFEALGLSFWFHPGDRDGEDVKAEFKARLLEAEELLTVEERADVVAEAKKIFTRCTMLVGELDEMFGSGQRSHVAKSPAGGRPSALWWYCMWVPMMGSMTVYLGWLTMVAAGRFNDSMMQA